MHSTLNNADEKLKFYNPEIPLDERLDDLIAHLTIDEKISQLFNSASAVKRLGKMCIRDRVFTDPWMMSKDSNNPDEAWEFIKFLASPEIQQEWMELTGAPPVRTSLLNVWADSFTTMSADEVMEDVYKRQCLG